MKNEVKTIRQWGVVQAPYGDLVGQLHRTPGEAKKAAEEQFEMSWKKLLGAGYSLVQFQVSRVLNKSAQELGRLAAGKPKKFSPEEIAKRTARLAAARAARQNQKS